MSSGLDAGDCYFVCVLLCLVLAILVVCWLTVVWFVDLVFGLVWVLLFAGCVCFGCWWLVGSGLAVFCLGGLVSWFGCLLGFCLRVVVGVRFLDLRCCFRLFWYCWICCLLVVLGCYVGWDCWLLDCCICLGIGLFVVCIWCTFVCLVGLLCCDCLLRPVTVAVVFLLIVLLVSCLCLYGDAVCCVRGVV